MKARIQSKSLESRVVPGNRITLLKNGADFFPALIEAIDAAITEIRLETYIFSDDVAGTAIAEALMRAAQRKVNVEVLIDGVGSHSTPQAFFDGMQRAGVVVMVFRPERKLFSFKKSRLRRVHRKIALIDGRIGFVGGINLIDDMTDCLSEFPRYDYAVRVEGPVLADIYMQMVRLWRTVSWWKLGRRPLKDSMPDFPTHVPASLRKDANVGDMHAFFAVRDNFRHRRDIERAYMTAIGTARREVLITSPYFCRADIFVAC